MTDFEEPGSWSLTLPSGVILWTGKLHASPSLKELSLLLLLCDSTSEKEADSNISFLSAQIIRSCQPKYIPILLSGLACHFWRHPSTNELDINRLLSLQNDAKKSVCGVVFKEGDLVWTCISCGKDQTCVQCDNCYRHSNHDGHDVFFRRSQGDGGCCDCGDPEAWAPSGNCIHHSGVADDEILKPSLEPLQALPPGLLRGLRAVLKGTVGVAISYIVCAVRGFQPYNSNPFVRWCEEFELNMTGKLHNDDIHTYGDVSNCLIALEFQPGEAEQLTASVDKAGEATVVSSAEPEVLKATSRAILKENLLFSILPEDILKVEGGVSASFNWMQTLGSGGHSGLRCAVVETILMNVEEFPEYTSVIEVETDSEGAEKQKQLSLLVAPNRTFADEEQFPSLIPQLDRDFQPPHMQTPDGLKVFWSESIKVYSRPFQHCPHSAFAVFVMASPFLSNTLKANVNSVVIYFQHDNYFKFAFSQIFMFLYPSLYALYLRFVGTAIGNFFTTSVQLFTANSIVDCLSSDGFDSRLFPDASVERPCLTTIFMRLLLTGLSHIGSTGVNNSHKDFLKHAVLTNHSEPRMAHLFRDIDYVLKSPITCSRILAGLRDPDTFDVLVEIICRLQNLEKMKRRVGTHVEEDDRSWDSAINLMLEIEGVSTNLISHAYFPFISSNAAWGYNTITKSIDTLSSESEKLSYNAVLREGLLRSLRKLSSAFLLHFGPPSTTADPEPSNSASSLGIGSLLGSFGLGAIRPNAGGTVTGMTASTLNGNTSATSRFNFTQRAMSTAARPITSFGSSLRSNLPSAIPSRDIEDQFMFQMLKSLTALGHSVTFPGKLGYRVSQYHVSFHIPLQRVISKFFKYACLSGLDVSDALRYLKYEAPPIFVNSIADFPLRCLSLISQVSVGMWKRNGISVSNVAYNYNRPIFSKTFRYADLHSIQIAMVVLGEDSVLALALDRFELLNFLEADSDLSLTSEQYVEFKGPLLAEFLKFLSNLILYVPAIVTSNWEVNISKDDVETLPKAVARELVHHVFVGDTRRGDGFTQVIKPASFSSMLRVKNVVATSKHVTESLIRSVSANYCTQKQGNADEEESAGYDLSEKGFQLIDLEYGCWSPEEQQRAAEKVKDIHKKLFDKQAGIGKLKSSKPFFRPVISFDAIPNAHPAFVSVRKALYRPLTFSILEKSLVLCELKVNREGLLRKCFTAILCRVVHVVTLQIICLDTFGSGSESGSSYSDQFYNNSFRPSSGEGYKLLIALGQLWNAKLLKDEEVYLSGLGWILSHLYTRSADAKSVLEEKGISFSDSADQKQEAQEAGSKSALAKKKAAAQQRALAAMSKQAMSFSATMDEDDDDVDESKNDSMKNVSNIESIKGTLSLEDGASDCIMCRDRNGGTIGYLCYLQPSSTLSNAIKQCPSDDVVNSIKQVYRVVSLGGCQVHSRGNETSPVVSQLNYGDHIRAKQRVGIWLEIVAPIHGWVAYYSPNPKHNAGLPSAVTFPYIVQLHRVLDLTFHKHGPARIHVSICGHAMHITCWNALTAKTLNINPNMIDTIHGERVCPFCKGLCNTLLPHIPPHLAIQPKTTTESSSSLVLKSLVGSSQPVSSELIFGMMSQITASRSLSTTAAYVESVAALSISISAFTTRIKDLFPLPWYNQSSEQVANFLEQNVIISRTRSMFSLWSSTAYTILSEITSTHTFATSVHSDLNDTRVDDSFGCSSVEAITHSTYVDSKALQVSLQLLASTTLLTHAYSDQFLDVAVRDPLRMLISGQRPSLFNALCCDKTTTADQSAPSFKMLSKFNYSKQDIWSILATLPFTNVETNSFPDARRLGFILQHLQDTCPHEALWGWLLKPLLNQDLHTVLVAAIGVSSSVDASCDLCRLLALARLIQCLSEPSCNGLYKSEYNSMNSESESMTKRRKGDGPSPVKSAASTGCVDTDKYPHVRQPEMLKMISSLTTLRNAVYEDAQLQTNINASVEGAELLKTVLESWVIYLEFASYIRDRLSPTGSDSQSDFNKMDQEEGNNNDVPKAKVGASGYDQFLPRVESLLQSLGLPSMLDLLESPGLKEYARIWTRQYVQEQSFLLPKVSNSSTDASHQKSLSSSAVSTASQKDSFSSRSPSPSIKAMRTPQMMVSDDIMFSGSAENALNDDHNDIGENESDNNDESDDDDDDDDDDDEGERGMNDAALQPAMMTGAETLEDLLMHLLAQPNVSDEEVGMFLEAHAMQANNSSKVVKEGMWRLIGVDPTLPFIDDHSISLFSANELRSFPSVTPFQGSLTGQYACYGLTGNILPTFMCDFSHFGLKVRHRVGLIPLPKLYTDIYHATKFYAGPESPPVDDPCICLICGRVLSAGNKQVTSREGSDGRSVGECSIHARHCGSGTGVFFLVQHLSVLLVYRSYSAYYPSLYLDINGEIDKMKNHSRPMFLSVKRYKKVEELYVKHQVPYEIARQRTTKGSYIRQDWY